MLKPVLERFLEKINISDVHSFGGTPCWEWTACKLPGGYGQFYFKGQRGYAHRFIFEYYHGEIDDTLEIDHLCRNRACENVLHLEQVTKQDNIRRGNAGRHKNHASGINNYNGKKTHCPQGHEFTPENTIIRKRGGRNCRKCHNIGARKSKPKNQ